MYISLVLYLSCYSNLNLLFANFLDFMQKEQPSLQESAKESQEASEKQTHSSDGSMDIVSPKSSSEIEDSSPTFGSESSTLTDVSINDEVENNSDTVNKESSDKPRFRKSHSSGLFRNLITCGGVETNDAMVVMTKKRSKPFLNVCSSCSSVEVKNSAKEEGRFREPCTSHKPLHGPNCSYVFITN